MTSAVNQPPAARDPESLPVIGDARLSHGTLESRDLPGAKRFYRDFLGLLCIRHREMAQAITDKEFHFAVACVKVPSRTPMQGVENRWLLVARDDATVERAHCAAVERSDSFGISSVSELTGTPGSRSFLLRDLDGNWWEIASRTPRFYHEIFARGDID